jgi:sugar/nucleoside kinase (ribokinase family)
MRSVVVAGHVCVDLIPEVPGGAVTAPGGLLEVGPLTMAAGGCVANTGGALAALGADVEVVADAGDDELGAVLVPLLRARGMRTDQIRLRDGRSTSYSLVFEGEDRSFWHHVGANAGWDGTAVDVTGARLLHVGYPSLLPGLIADGGRPLEALLARARAAGVTTSLDLAVLDPASAAAREDWPGLLGRVLPLVDVFSPSVDDVRTALRVEEGADLRETARMLRDLGPAIVLLTAGPAGLQLVTGDAARLATAGGLLEGRARWSGQEHFTSPPAVEVRSTLGAGDAATAGLLFGLLEGLDPLGTLELAARTAAARVAGAPLTSALP